MPDRHLLRTLLYRRVWHSLLNFLVQVKRLDRSLVSLDGTLIPSQEFTGQTGYSGQHRLVGTKLSLLVDRSGTPLALSVAPSNYHLPDLAKTTEPTLLADKGYDSRRFRQFVSDQGFRPLIPSRRCIPAEQATGDLYDQDVVLQRKRYVVERTIGWLKGFRRLRFRVDRTVASFHAFVYLAVLVLCVRRVINPCRAVGPAR